MDFLESAAVLIPALTGLEMTFYEEDAGALRFFEERYCLSPELQRSYTAEELAGFLRAGDRTLVYDLLEPLGTRLAALWAGSGWLLLGPYVEDGWSEHTARARLTGLDGDPAALASYKSYWCSLPIARHENTLSAAFLLAGRLNSAPCRLHTVRLSAPAQSGLPHLSDGYGNAAEVNRRYQQEDRFIAAIRCGDAGRAYQAMREINRSSSGIRFGSDRMSDQIAGAAILRTLIRIGAKQAGISPVRIDSISQEQAQRMQHAATKRELDELILRLVDRFCAEARAVHQAGYSPAVRRAVDYIDVNLSRPMTVDEIAAAAQADRRRLTLAFGRETGRTIKQYLAQKRCESAAALLRSGTASIQQVAAWVGYADNNYFSKVFKAHFGMTPQLYRESGEPAE